MYVWTNMQYFDVGMHVPSLGYYLVMDNFLCMCHHWVSVRKVCRVNNVIFSLKIESIQAN